MFTKEDIMSLQAEIRWIQNELNKVEDRTLLDAIKRMLKSRAKIEQPKRISVEQYNKEIEDADARIDAGVFYTEEEAEKIMNKW